MSLTMAMACATSSVTDPGADQGRTTLMVTLTAVGVELDNRVTVNLDGAPIGELWDAGFEQARQSWLLPVGNHRVTVSDVAEGCNILPSGGADAVLVAGQTTVLNLTLSCRGTGALEGAVIALEAREGTETQQVNLVRPDEVPTKVLGWSPSLSHGGSRLVVRQGGALSLVDVSNGNSSLLMLPNWLTDPVPLAWSPAPGGPIVLQGCYEGCSGGWGLGHPSLLLATESAGGWSVRGIRERAPTAIAWSPNGGLLAVSEAGLVMVLRADGTEVGQVGASLQTQVYGLSFSPDGARLAATSLLPEVTILDLATGSSTGLSILWASTIRQVTWLSDGRLVLGGTVPGRLNHACHFVTDAQGQNPKLLVPCAAIHPFAAYWPEVPHLAIAPR